MRLERPAATESHYNTSSKMKLILLLSTLVVISHQQYRARPRETVWLSHYPHRDVFDYPARRYNNYFPFRQTNRIGDLNFQNDDYNQDFADTLITHNVPVDDESVVEVPVDTQSRAKGVLRWPSIFYSKQNAGRFFYSSTINNPFIRTATFTLSTTVTTIGSIVLCVPSNNLAAVPAPTCAGRKKRHAESEDADQFPISPSETLKLMPTALPSLDSPLTNNRESRRLSLEHFQMLNPQGVSSSKDEISSAGTLDDDQTREKRFGGGIAASTTVTSYSFVAATLTNTVLLDPTAGGLAACLPAGYVVC